MSQQSDAQDILNALSTTGRTDVPATPHPGPLKAGATAEETAAHGRHMDAHVLHLQNKKSGDLSQAERITLAQAIVSGLRADGFIQ